MDDIISALENYSVKKSLYDEEFFRSHLKYRPIYSFIGDLIIAHLQPKSVIDWGCGCGFLLERLHQHGLSDLVGVEGSEKVQDFWKAELPAPLVEKLFVGDIIGETNVADEYYDLAICMEVAEHISEEHAEDFVDIISRSSSKMVWFSAAQPGQGGTGHINLKPLHYWSNLFENVSDFKPDWELTYKIKQEMLKNHALVIGYPWFRDNVIVFVK